MTLRLKAKIMDAEAVKRALVRIAHEILEKNKEAKELAIIGIKNRGDILGERVAAEIEKIAGQAPEVGTMDITLYRDDLTKVAEQPVLHATEINFDITEKNVVLVDDVLFTGRTIRCALDELMDFGRPKNIQLAVLIDRGHRELPIRADYVGKNAPTSLKELVEVKLKESDGEDDVSIYENI
jgi:pyrimidine operon attenuation protein/uracil phosphoribosyltransferase